MSTIRNQQLQRYARPLRNASERNDNETPFSFIAWYNSYQGIVPGQEYNFYNQYLVNWYKNKSNESNDLSVQIRLNYLKLLRQIQLFFTKSEIESWYNNINLNNDKEILLAIPYFAKKLKNIAFYYYNLRESIKKSRLKYNLVGTNKGLELQLKDTILTNFTKKQDSTIPIPANIWSEIPELSSVQDTFNIEIEELYDTFNYFDHSPTVSVSAYHDLNLNNLEEYFNSVGLELTSTEWIYKTGIFELSGEQIIDDINISEQIVNKYLNANKFTSLSVVITSNIDFYEVPIEGGNNFFYWPYGAYTSNITDLPRYVSQPLSSANIETLGTGGSSLETADTIFVKSVNNLQGAWLRKKTFDTTDQVMKTTIFAQKTTKFRYPFPDFGLSSEEIGWTGFGFITNPQYYYLDENIKKNIEKEYWSTNIELTSHIPININSTTLIQNKAHSSDLYNFADRVRVWETSPQFESPAYNGPVNEAWLYKMTKTDLPIAPESNSTIIWPYMSLTGTDVYPEFIPDFINESCLPVPLSSIVFNNSTASDNISGSDIIYKVKNFQDDINDAVECAWLSGESIYYPLLSATTPLQPGLNIVCNSGEFTKFIWQGQNLTDCNLVFKSYKHEQSCPFSLNSNLSLNDYQECTCQQVYVTPLGHPGDKFTDNGSFSDFIVEDLNAENFDFSNWVDSNNNPALSSDRFAWFKTENVIGWGNGTWVNTANNNSLLLRTGNTYIYYRQQTKNLNKEDFTLPEYAVRYSYENYKQNKFKWIQGIKNSNNEWISSNRVSKFTIYPGDILIYSKKPSSILNISQPSIETQTITENRGSIWSNLDYVSLDEDLQIIVSYPATPQNIIGGQYPSLNFLNVFSILQWSLSAPGQPIRFFRDIPSLVITPDRVGIYTIGVTAVSAATNPPSSVFFNITADSTFYYTNTGIYIFNNIPAITAISPETVVFNITSSEIPAPGFVLNTPLYGWNYNTSVSSTDIKTGNYGARPYWAKGETEKNKLTKYKGIESWGNYKTYFNNYNIISQPTFSDIIFKTGSYIEYIRNNNIDFIWEQPLKQRVNNEQNIWSTININTTSESTLQDILQNNFTDLIVEPTEKNSSILLESLIDNKPVEIYYNALESFVWPVTAVPVILENVVLSSSPTQITNIQRPWANLTSRYYPNIALLPTIQNLSSTKQIEGFFAPSYLGISQYINKDFLYTTTLSSPTLTGVFEDPKQFLGGRGLTKQDQNTPYQIFEDNNTWLKEPAVAGALAGNIKKNVFKRYQKFLPYEEKLEIKPFSFYGLVTPNSRLTPWTGPNDTIWNDPQTYPVSFTGEINVDVWTDQQILKNTNLQLYQWCTDVYGNQYGLYKNLKNKNIKQKKNTTGEIWVRNNSQKVIPGIEALSSVFDTFKPLPPLYYELTNTGVQHIDVFFNTLYVQTTGFVVFSQIIYEYNFDNILSLADETRYFSLQYPIEINTQFKNVKYNDPVMSKPGETWFFPDKQIVILPIAALSGTDLILELYEYNLNTLILQKVFPLSFDTETFKNAISGLNISNFEPPTCCYNTLKKQFIISLLCQNDNSQDIIIEIIVNNFTTITIETITIYAPTVQTLPPYIDHSLNIFQSCLSCFELQLTAQNLPVTYEPLNIPSWITFTNTGLLSGIIPNQGTYEIPFIVSNLAGPAYYTLTLYAQ